MHYMFHSIGAFIGGLIGAALVIPTNDPCGIALEHQSTCQNVFGSAVETLGAERLSGSIAVCAIIGLVIGHLVKMVQENDKAKV